MLLKSSLVQAFRSLTGFESLSLTVESVGIMQMENFEIEVYEERRRRSAQTALVKSLMDAAPTLKVVELSWEAMEWWPDTFYRDSVLSLS